MHENTVFWLAESENLEAPYRVHLDFQSAYY